jgi:hypothetical protein
MFLVFFPEINRPNRQQKTHSSTKEPNPNQTLLIESEDILMRKKYRYRDQSSNPEYQLTQNHPSIKITRPRPNIVHQMEIIDML